MQKDFCALTNYYVGPLLGNGSHSHVFLGKHKVTSSEVAIKVFRKNTKNYTEIKRVYDNEVAIMSSLSNQFIVEFYEMKEDDKYLYLIMEYAENGDLNKFIATKKKCADNEARRIFNQILSVFTYLNDTNKIIHRGLNCKHILLDEFNNIRISGFGTAKSIQNRSKVFSSINGSPADTEQNSNNSYDVSSDIWDIGVVLYTLLVGMPPFTSTEYDDQTIEMNPVYPLNISSGARDLLSRMLVKDVSERITLEQIKQHEWVSTSVSIENINKIYNAESSKVDQDIVGMMVNLRVNCSTLLHDLKSGIINDVTVIYDILHRQKINAIIGAPILNQSQARSAVIKTGYTQQLETVRRLTMNRANDVYSPYSNRENIAAVENLPNKLNKSPFPSPRPNQTATQVYTHQPIQFGSYFGAEQKQPRRSLVVNPNRLIHRAKP